MMKEAKPVFYLLLLIVVIAFFSLGHLKPFAVYDAVSFSDDAHNNGDAVNLEDNPLQQMQQMPPQQFRSPCDRVTNVMPPDPAGNLLDPMITRSLDRRTDPLPIVTYYFVHNDPSIYPSGTRVTAEDFGNPQGYPPVLRPGLGLTDTRSSLPNRAEPVTYDKGVFYKQDDTARLFWLGIGEDGVPLTGDEYAPRDVTFAPMLAGYSPNAAMYGVPYERKDLARYLVFMASRPEYPFADVIFEDPGVDEIPMSGDWEIRYVMDPSAVILGLPTFSHPGPPPLYPEDLAPFDVKVNIFGYVAILYSHQAQPTDVLGLYWWGRDHRWFGPIPPSDDIDQRMFPSRIPAPSPPENVIADLSPDSGQLAWVEFDWATPLFTDVLKVYNAGPANIPQDGDDTTVVIDRGVFHGPNLPPVVRINKDMMAYYDVGNNWIVLILPIDSYYGARSGRNNDIKRIIPAPLGFVPHTLSVAGTTAMWQDSNGVSYYRPTHPTLGC